MARATPTLLLCALLGQAACQPEAPGAFALEAALGLGAGEVDLGAVGVGDRRTFELPLHNRGQVALQVEARVVDATAPVFSIAPAVVFLDVGDQVALTLGFVPHRVQRFSATLLVSDSADPEVTAAAALLGEGLLPDCDDRNPCTEDWFELDLLRCLHAPASGSCDDGRRCTEADRCVEGSCQGQPITCDDGVGCTLDYCDEERGCVADPDHHACVPGDDPCIVGVCDAERGCLVNAAPDGTLCGELDCGELHVCVMGECRSGPAPEGLPCDDGDPCTIGDACHDGVCVPGPGEALAISTPQELDLLRINSENTSSYWDGEPVAALAVNTPTTGGVDVVWSHYPYWQSNAVQVMRSRVDADGTLRSTLLLGEASDPSAAFIGDDLILSLNGCQSCYDPMEPCGGGGGDSDPDGVCMPTYCSHQLLRLSAGSVITRSACLDPGGGSWPTMATMATDRDQVYLARLLVTQLDGTMSSGLVELSQYDADLGLVRSAQAYPWSDPIPLSGTPPLRDLCLSVRDGEPQLAFSELTQMDPQEVRCCPSDDCGLGVDAVVWDWVNVGVTRLFRSGLEPLVYTLGSAGRDVTLASVHGLTGTQSLLVIEQDSDLLTCSPMFHLQAFGVADDDGALATTALGRFSEQELSGVTGATLFEQPILFTHAYDGGLGLLGLGPQNEVLEARVPMPSSLDPWEERVFMERSWLWHDSHLLATAPLEQGLVAVVMTRSSYHSPPPPADEAVDEGAPEPEPPSVAYVEPDPPRLALFTIGCGAALEPIVDP